MVTREEAIKLGLKRYNTGKPCSNGHMSDRYTLRSQCVQCIKDTQTIRPGYKAGCARRQKKIREDLKKLVIDHYGQCCQCCGEKEMVFLCIDHMGGGGNEHRRSLGPGRPAMYRWLRDNNFPEGYQVLCWNCNAAKSILGECPHKREEAKSCG